MESMSTTLNTDAESQIILSKPQSKPPQGLELNQSSKSFDEVRDSYCR
jgi:hypothetical protein